MSALEPARRGNYWDIVITDGPSYGLTLGKAFDLKRDAVAYIGSVEHLPWNQVQPNIGLGPETWEPIVTVSRGALEDLLAENVRLKDEVEAARRVLIMVDGSFAAMAKAKRGEPIDTVWRLPANYDAHE